MKGKLEGTSKPGFGEPYYTNCTSFTADRSTYLCESLKVYGFKKKSSYGNKNRLLGIIMITTPSNNNSNNYCYDNNKNLS